MSMRTALLHLAALLLGALAALALAACGGDEDRSGLLPAGDAQALSDRLDAVRADVEDGECDALAQDLVRLRNALVALPSSVDPRLRERLEEGVANLAEIAPGQCAEVARGETTTTETQTTETQTTTTAIPTVTTPVETAPPTTTATPTTTTPPTTTPPGTGGVEPGTPTTPVEPGGVQPGTEVPVP